MTRAQDATLFARGATQKQTPACRGARQALKQLQKVAMAGGTMFEELKTVQSCSLGQITHALYEVGGRYRRSMEFPEPWLTEASASLERMRWDGATEVRYRRKTCHERPAGSTFAPEEHFDPADFPARVLMDVPEPRRHLVRYSGPALTPSSAPIPSLNPVVDPHECERDFLSLMRFAQTFFVGCPLAL